MSRLYEALSKMRIKAAPLETAGSTFCETLREREGSKKLVAEFRCGESVMLNAPPESRLVALTGRSTLGADKFRALGNRLTHLRTHNQLRSLQVTSSGVGEGKTVVAANLALTFATHARCRTLLVEGDLHRPAIASTLGLRRLYGLTDWWSSQTSHLASYSRRIHGTSLWVLTAGSAYAQPSEILASQRFKQAFADIAENFEWVVVDSPPISPVVDVNLWSSMLDGTILVVREGVTPIRQLKKSLAILDEPKLIGVVLNEASELDGASYQSRYYTESSRAET
jgi:capsular exopolysaccharide synthesis family protein